MFNMARRRRRSNRRKSKKKLRFKFNECSNRQVSNITKATIKKPKDIFEIVCVHNSGNSKVTNLFIIGGLINGRFELSELDDILWMAALIDIVDLTQTNIFIVQWDSRSIRTIFNDTKRFFQEQRNIPLLLGLTASIVFKKTVLLVVFLFMFYYFGTTYYKAKSAGKLLANFIENFKPKKHSRTVLVGHSLGGKVIVDCLAELYQRGYSEEKSLVSKTVILGTAEYNDRYDPILWNNASRATIYRSVNVYNPRDKLLSIGFGKVGKLIGIGIMGDSKDIAGLTSVGGFDNLNCSSEMYRPVNERCKEHPPGAQDICRHTNFWGHNYTSMIEWIFKQSIVKEHGLAIK